MRISPHIWAGVAFVAYVALAALSAESLWFRPSVPVFADATEGEVPALTYSRAILRPADIRYSVVVRATGQAWPACESPNGPFPYLAASGPVDGKDLAWWAPNDPRCLDLPPGSYWAVTTWEVIDPLGDLLPAPLDGWLGWILPPKRLTRESPLFTIHPEVLQ